MISCNVIQQLYVDLYRCLRRYIWDFNVIKIIAQLEVLCYTAFSDIHDICNCLNNLYSFISPACSDDDELHRAIVKFQDAVSSQDVPYVKLFRVREVLPDENS